MTVLADYPNEMRSPTTKVIERSSQPGISHGPNTTPDMGSLMPVKVSR